MECRQINILLSCFTGISPSSTRNYVVPNSTSITDALQRIQSDLPKVERPLFITTHLNRIVALSDAPVATLLTNKRDGFIHLRLSAGLYGGKGGFGSQLRAAGGRMSSKRKKTQGENNGSNRNLEGRRLRTVNEAKALAEYLALRPEMERKEKEEKRKRWQQVIELTERREEELRDGSRGKLDGEWLEAKEDASERTRIAAKTAMESSLHQKQARSSSTYLNRAADASSPLAEPGNKRPSTSQDGVTVRKFDGFDNDDQFLSDAEDEDCSDRRSSLNSDLGRPIMNG